MRGVQLIRLLDAVDVLGVEPLPGVVPRSVRVRGRDFRSIEQIFLNGFEAPEFVVYSSTELAVQVPMELALAQITDVLVLSRNLTLTERSLIDFTVGTRVQTARGTVRLMQTFLRLLLRTPGSNLFHPTSGGGLHASVGGNITPRSAADIHVAVGQARQQMLAAQAGQSGLSPTERLMGAEVAGVRVDPQRTSIYATIILTSAAGDRAGTTLNL
jgi:hypothetical protein